MDAFEVLTQEIDEKVEQLQEFLAQGRAESYEEYKKVCGEIKGLLTARSHVLDLKHRMENADDT